ncbi:MAG: LysM peptidoglycan-binding domain-containing protein [Terrimicrobiaceae bacterium]
MKMKPTARPPGPRRVPRRMVKTLHARAATREEDFDDNDGGSEPNMKLSHAFIVVLLLHILAVGGVFAFNSLKSRNIVPDRSKPTETTKAATAASPDVVTGTTAKTAAASPAHEGSSATAKTPAKSQTPEAGGTTYTVVAGDTLTKIATGQKTTVEAIEQANGIESNSAIRVGQVLKIPSKGAPAPAKIVPKQETLVAKTAEVKPAAAAAKTTETKPAPVAAKTAEVKPAAAAAKTAEAKPAPVAKTTETATKPAAGTPPKEEPAATASEKSYTVAKGDNPYSIAKKLKVSYSELIKANNIADPTKLQIGQKLMIP